MLTNEPYCKVLPKSHLSLTQGESYTSVQCRDPAKFSDYPKDSENVCYAQMSPHFSLFFGKTDFLEFLVPGI